MEAHRAHLHVITNNSTKYENTFHCTVSEKLRSQSVTDGRTETIIMSLRRGAAGTIRLNM